MCSSFSALPVSSQRKVVVPYSLVSHPHCPLLDSPSTSHTCPLCYPLPHSLICVVPSGSTCQGTIQHSLPNKVCVKYYLLLQQFLLFVFPPTPSHSFPLLLSPPHSLSLPLAPSHSLSLWSLISVMSLAHSHFSSPAQFSCFFFLIIKVISLLSRYSIWSLNPEKSLVTFPAHTKGRRRLRLSTPSSGMSPTHGWVMREATGSRPTSQSSGPDAGHCWTSQSRQPRAATRHTTSTSACE